MTNTDTAIIEAIRNAAVTEGKLPLAHLCTAALNNETWAQQRLFDRLNQVLETIDTTRPDGAIARSIEM